jgi:predicted nucleic acid-binding protein
LLVIDANIAVKFVATEPGQKEAFVRVNSEDKLVAPDWILMEVGHALWRKVKSGEIHRADAERGLAALPVAIQIHTGSSKIIGRAQELSFKLDHWLYDCVYLATALDLAAPLLTADRKFWSAAKRAGYGDTVELLTWEGQSD